MKVEILEAAPAQGHRGKPKAKSKVEQRGHIAMTSRNAPVLQSTPLERILAPHRRLAR